MPGEKEYAQVEVSKLIRIQFYTHELSASQQQLARLDLKHNVAFLLEGYPNGWFEETCQSH